LQTKDSFLLTLLKGLVSLDTLEPTPEYAKINRPIQCRELSATDNTDLALVNGELIGNRSPDFCKGIPMTNPYDSRDWQISAPIFYFQGAKDNLTTLDQAKYHYYQQKKTKRFFVTLPEDSHVFSMCKNNEDALWRSMAKQGQDFETVLSNCSGAPQLEISNPTQ